MTPGVKWNENVIMLIESFERVKKERKKGVDREIEGSRQKRWERNKERKVIYFSVKLFSKMVEIKEDCKYDIETPSGRERE